MKGVFTLGAVTLAAAALAATSGASSDPSVRVAALKPLRVVGTHFHPRERVRVVAVTGEGRLARTVRTTRAGGFSVSFATLFVDLCNTDLRLYATGGRGDRDGLKLPQRECPPAP